MRVIYYEKRKLSKRGYIFANAQIDDDETDIITEDNVYADGFNMTINHPHSHRKDDMAANIEISSDFKSREERDKFKVVCESFLKGEQTAEWKIVAVQVTPICITIYIINPHLYENTTATDIYFDGKIEIGTTKLLNTDFIFKTSSDDVVTQYKVSTEYGCVKVIEDEEKRKRELVFTSKEKKSGRGIKRYIQETEWLY